MNDVTTVLTKLRKNIFVKNERLRDGVEYESETPSLKAQLGNYTKGKSRRANTYTPTPTTNWQQHTLYPAIKTGPATTVSP